VADESREGLRGGMKSRVRIPIKKVGRGGGGGGGGGSRDSETDSDLDSD
jgi:hypothetical protein